MGYYITMPVDEYGNTWYPASIMEGDVEDTDIGLQLTIREPKEIAAKWPTMRLIHGIVPFHEGPARMLDYDEHKALVAEVINRDPDVAGAYMVTLKDGSSVPLTIAKVCLMGLGALLKEDPIGFYELVTATRDPDHQFFGDYQERLRGRGFLGAEGRPAGAFRSTILNAVEGEDFQMRLVNPERPRDH